MFCSGDARLTSILELQMCLNASQLSQWFGLHRLEGGSKLFKNKSKTRTCLRSTSQKKTFPNNISLTSLENEGGLHKDIKDNRSAKRMVGFSDLYWNAVNSGMVGYSGHA